jgi:hypothetical protein
VKYKLHSALESAAEIPAGEYWVQAVLNVYTTFKRADGNTIQAHMDQWEGQKWNLSPGNLISEPVKIRVDAKAAAPIKIALAKKIPLDHPWQADGIDTLALDSQTLETWKLANLSKPGARFLFDLAVSSVDFVHSVYASTSFPGELEDEVRKQPCVGMCYGVRTGYIIRLQRLSVGGGALTILGRSRKSATIAKS